MATLTLDKMARGALFDQLGGGFHRYTVDALWRTPHYEKMLVDNALLARLYYTASIVTGRSDFKQVAEQTIEWMLREMQLPDGGFAAALDADTEGEEGKYYLWSANEVAEILDPVTTSAVCQMYGLWGGTRQPLVAQGKGDANRVEQGKRRLLEVRSKRVAPARDEQLIIEANGLALSALAVMGYIEPAVALVRRVTSVCGDSLCHLIADGKAVGEPLPQDIGAWIDGLVDLYQATWDESYLKWALSLAGKINDLRPRPHLFAQPSLIDESGTPSPLALLVRALGRLGHLTQQPEIVQAAERFLRRHGGGLDQRRAPYFPYLLLAAGWVEGPVRLVQLLGTSDQVKPFIEVIHRHPLAECLVRYQYSDQLDVSLCEGFECTAQPPNPTELEAALQQQELVK
jgi:uncharacterized protein YyaL (SSP411 family)